MTLVLAIRGIQEGITEEEIKERIKALGFEVQKVEILRDRSSGKSIGLALVKFYSVEDATRCLQDYPVIDIRGDPAWLEAGFEHSNEDWRCFRCRAVNLPRRRFCFKCNERRRDDAEPEKETEIDLTMLPGADDLSPQPTSFILIQSIGNSTAAELFEMFKSYRVHRVAIVQERLDNSAKGFGFLQFESVEVAQSTLLSLRALPSCPFYFSFGRDLRASALLLNPDSLMQDGLAYWDSKCVLNCFPVVINEGPLVSELLLSVPQKQRSTTNTMPILAKPAKKLELKRWSQKANQIDEPSSTEIKPSEIPKFLDFESGNCHLCDGLQFATAEELKTHAQTSESHALKFTEYLARTEIAKTIRDRAAERRLAFAFDEDDMKKETVREASTPIELVDSVGARLLKKMGWREGQGLGRDGSGITEPLNLRTVEQIGAGLDASILISTEEYAAGKTVGYIDKAKAGRKKRYNEDM